MKFFFAIWLHFQKQRTQRKNIFLVAEIIINLMYLFCYDQNPVAQRSNDFTTIPNGIVVKSFWISRMRRYHESIPRN